MTYSSTVDATPSHDLTTSNPSLVGRGGFAYVAAWVAGLTVHAGGVTGEDSPAAVAAHYSSHRAAALTQVLLVHGVAAVALAVFAVGLARLAARRTGQPHRAVAVAGGLAALTSLVQMTIGVVMVTGAGTDAADATHRWLTTIEWLDAAKLVALAVLSWTAAAGIRQACLRRWTAVVADVAAVALLTAAIGLAGFAPLVPAAALALGLLLLWVGGVAFTARRER